MAFYVLEPCKTRAGFEAIPERKLSWDLNEAEGKLSAAGIPTIVSAGVILVVMGIALITGHLTEFAFILIEVFPALGRIG